MRTARGVCGPLAGIAAALALVVMDAPRATAGGSTSVLVVSPGSGQSAALYVSDRGYGELERGLGELGGFDEGRRERPPGLSMGDGSRQITVTWLVHDVRPWRVDRAYPVATGSEDGAKTEALWIHTTTDVESMTGTWHKAENPARLTALFKKLGVMGPPRADGNRAGDDGNRARGPGAGSTPPSASAPEAGPEQVATGRADGTPGDGGTDWWWAIPGAAAGAAGVLLLRGPLTEHRPFPASLRGRRPPEDGPWQELRDL
ncbi:hypothetical protein [Streptomyces longisporoflavus]|uniref:Secreted protein n=1 Tax=Streptomyces longisporoflavus TaxID=28044 RepID=A0ABW7QRR8_9ACTN